MNALEHALDCIEKFFTIDLGLLIGQLGQELDVADQMSDAKLHQHIEILHVLSIGREVVTANGALEFTSQHLDEDLGTARFIDAEEHIQILLEDPCPKQISVLFMACLIDIQGCLQGEMIE